MRAAGFCPDRGMNQIPDVRYLALPVWRIKG
jgi:hypothetical protein